MTLVLNVDREGYPHVQGVRWDGEEIFRHFYQQIYVKNGQAFYRHDGMEAQIHAFDEPLFAVGLEEKTATLLGSVQFPRDDIYLDATERPVCYVTLPMGKMRCRIANYAFYDWIHQTGMTTEPKKLRYRPEPSLVEIFESLKEKIDLPSAVWTEKTPETQISPKPDIFDQGYFSSLPGDKRDAYTVLVKDPKVKSFHSRIYLAHDELGPPWGATESEIEKRFLVGSGFETLRWERSQKLLQISLQRK